MWPFIEILFDDLCTLSKTVSVHVCVLQLTVLMDTMCVPVSLRPYLPLYLELVTESPVLRDDGACCSSLTEFFIPFS